METGVRFNTAEVLPNITTLASVINSINVLRILSDIKLEFDGGDYITATTANMETWLSMRLKVIGSCAELSPFCINAYYFLKALRNLPNVDVTMTVSEEKHTVTCNYGIGHFTMPFEKASEFPEPKMSMEGAFEFMVSDILIAKAIEKTNFAVANDQLRPIMNGIHFDFHNDAMTVASSDGQKLVRYRDTTIKHNDNDTYKLTIPSKPCTIIHDVLSLSASENEQKKVRFAFTDNAATINGDGFDITTRLIDGRYPNYESVIPKESTSLAIVNKDALCQALKRVLPMGSTTSELVSMEFKKGRVVINAEDIDFGKSASEIVACEFSGNELSIGFKGSSMIQVLSNLDSDNVSIEMSEPSRAAIVYANDKDTYLSLIMPMLLQ